MSRRATGAAFALALSAALTRAEEIEGKVVFVKGQEVRIRVSGDVAPTPGDPFVLYELQLDPMFQDEEFWGRGTVKSVKGDIVTASIDEGADEAPCRGQTVRIVSKQPVPLDPVSRKHDPLAGEPPTEDQVRAWVAAVSSGCAKGDYALLAETLDWDALDRRALDPLTLSKFVSIICTGMLALQSENFSEMLWRSRLARPASCRLLKFRQVGPETRALVRFTEGAAPRSLRYVDLVLLQSPTMDLRVIDAWQYETGELLSHYLRLMLLPDTKSLKRLNQMRSTSVADVVAVKEAEPLWTFAKLMHDADFEKALTHFERNGDALRQVPFAHVLRIAGAARAEPESCTRFAAEAEKALPGNPAFEYAAATALEAADQADLALAAWDRFETAIGGDPFLDLTRSRLHQAAGRLKEARECAVRATEAEPGLSDGWHALFGISLRQKDFKEGVSVLRSMKARGFEIEKIADLTGADEFMQSEEYATWKKER